MPAPAAVTRPAGAGAAAARNGAGAGRADGAGSQRRTAGLAVPPPDGQRAGRSGRGLRRGGARRRGHPLAARFRPHRGGRVQPGAATPAGGAAKPDDRRLPHPGAAVPRPRRGAPRAWRWPGSGAAGRARSICTRCCRCRPPSWRSARPIRRRWPGWRPIGARPIGCARSASGQPRHRPSPAARPRDRRLRVLHRRRDTAGGDRRLAARWPALHFVLQPRPAD